MSKPTAIGDAHRLMLLADIHYQATLQPLREISQQRHADFAFNAVGAAQLPDHQEIR
jgi:hypothetical protein